MSEPDTKTRLMDAAERLVRQHGADGISYSDLSTEVGIRKASIHYHYPAKSDMMTAIMKRYGQRVMATLSAFSTGLPDTAARLFAFIDLYRDALETGDRLCLCVAFVVNQDGLSPETRAEILQFRAHVLGWLEQTFVNDGTVDSLADPKADSAGLLALVEGAQIAARMAQDVSVFDKSCAAFKARLTA